MALQQLPAFEKLNLSTFRSKKYGITYVRGTVSQWNSQKKHSVHTHKEYIGTLNETTGRVHFSKKFLKRRPEFENLVRYYENNKLIERDESEVEKELAAVAQSHFDNNLSIGATWASWQSLESSGIYKDLKQVLGADAQIVLWLAVYVYLTGGDSMNGFAEWLKGHWLPNGKPLTSQRISDVLAKIGHQDIKDYCKLRYDRSLKSLEELAEKDGHARRQYLALDSTGIGTYSVTIEKAEYGHAKQDPELRQVNLTLGCCYGTGDICFAFCSAGSINDKALFKSLLADMQENGFDIGGVVIVTDRGFSSIGNTQNLVDIGANFVVGVPLSEDELKVKFETYKDSFSSSAFWNAELGVSARSFEDEYLRATETGHVPVKVHLHLYKNHEDALRETTKFMTKLREALRRKNLGLKVETKDWDEVGKYLEKGNDGVWCIKHKEADRRIALAGCFAIRSNCVEDPFECLGIYRARNVVEGAFRNFKDNNGGNRLFATETTYLGKILVHILAQSIRMMHRVSANEVREKKAIPIPGNSMGQVHRILEKVRLVRSPGRANWVLYELTKKARDCLELLGIQKPIPKVLKLA